MEQNRNRILSQVYIEPEIVEKEVENANENRLRSTCDEVESKLRRLLQWLLTI